MNPDIKIGDYVELKFGDIGRVVYVDEDYCIILNQTNNNRDYKSSPTYKVSNHGYNSYQAGFEDLISNTINEAIKYVKRRTYYE